MTHVMETVHRKFSQTYEKQRVILSFEDFIAQVKSKPRRYIRDAASYLLDTFDYFETRQVDHPFLKVKDRFQLFDVKNERCVPVVGGEQVHRNVYNLLQSFARQGFSSKLILLHGPNGSAKTSTGLINAMQAYRNRRRCYLSF